MKLSNSVKEKFKNEIQNIWVVLIYILALTLWPFSKY